MILFGEPGLAWIAAGLLLLVAELLAPGVFMMWLGLAAIGTGLIGRLAALGFGAEVVIFAALAAGFIGVGVRLRRRRAPATLNTPGSGLVGRTAQAMRFDGREGRVRLGDSDWSARLVPEAAIPVAGAALRVVGVDGTVLVVAAIERA